MNMQWIIKMVDSTGTWYWDGMTWVMHITAAKHYYRKQYAEGDVIVITGYFDGTLQNPVLTVVPVDPND
jgi:hypothetical protein